jgi:hypothetical protein
LFITVLKADEKKKFTCCLAPFYFFHEYDKALAVQGLYLYGKQESASNIIHCVWVIEAISF